MGFEGEHVPGAVVFLVLPGLLVLADDVPLIIVDVDAPDHADLGPAVHDLAIEVQRRLSLPDQHALGDEAVERLAGLAIDAGIVGVHVRRQVDVRPADVEEAVGISLRQLQASSRFTTS